MSSAIDPGHVAVLCGGVGAARFLRGLLEVVDPTTVTAIVNTADDMVLHGLSISPDLDTCTYTLADAINPETGWGLVDETWQAMDSLRRYGGQTWFGLGDRDLGTHLHRTQRLSEGATLTEVTHEITTAWNLGLRMLPVTNDRIATRITTVAGETLDFQRWFVGRAHQDRVAAVEIVGASEAVPAPGVLEALERAETLVIAPSNPIVSIGPLLAVPGVVDMLQRRRPACVAVSPIVGGAAVKGPAADMFQSLGHEVSAVGVAAIYASVAAHLCIDTIDAELADRVNDAGVVPHVIDTMMNRAGVAARLAEATIALSRRTGDTLAEDGP